MDTIYRNARNAADAGYHMAVLDRNGHWFGSRSWKHHHARAMRFHLVLTYIDMRRVRRALRAA